MKKPNAIIIGEIETVEGDDETHKIPFGLLIECSNPEQIREALKTGSIDFTVFGS